MFWQSVIFSGLCSISYLNKASNTLYYQHLNYLKSWLGKYWTILSIVPVNYVKTNILWPACRSARDWHPVSDFKITNSHIPEWKTCQLKTRKRTKSKVVDKKLESKFLYTRIISMRKYDWNISRLCGRYVCMHDVHAFECADVSICLCRWSMV